MLLRLAADDSEAAEVVGPSAGCCGGLLSSEAADLCTPCSAVGVAGDKPSLELLLLLQRLLSACGGRTSAGEFPPDGCDAVARIVCAQSRVDDMLQQGASTIGNWSERRPLKVRTCSIRSKAASSSRLSRP